MFIWSAFTALHTCRMVEGGPIPWTAVDAYGRRYCKTAADFDDLERSIRRLDTRYMELTAPKKTGRP